MKTIDPLRFPFSVGSTPTNLALGLAVIGFLGGGPVFFGSLLPNFMTPGVRTPDRTVVLPLDPRVLCCVRCGAPQPASAEDSIRCQYCAGQTPVPEALRNAVRDAASTAEHRLGTRSALKELQRWPRARRVNLLLGISLLPLSLSWPVIASFTSEFFQSFDILRWRDVFILFAATFSLSIGMVLLLQSQLVLRRAFALITASFHTLPPTEPGGAHRCRTCSAPLSVREQDDQPLIICPYCQSDNVVLGVLLPHTVHAEAQQRQSLDAILSARRRTRKRWQLGFVVSVLLMFAGGKVVYQTVVRVRASTLTRHAPVDRTWSYEPSWVK